MVDSPNEAHSTKWAIIISYPTSASEIIFFIKNAHNFSRILPCIIFSLLPIIFSLVNIQDVGATAKDSFGSLSGKYKMVSDKVI